MNFVPQVFPLIKEKVPEAKLYIVGRNPSKKILDLRSNSIIVTGTVSDVRKYYHIAKVSIAPFRLGGETKLKVLESLSMGVPIVSTSVGVQGINTLVCKAIFVRDDWVQFAKEIVKILQDKINYISLAKDGKLFVEEKYCWETII